MVGGTGRGCSALPRLDSLAALKTARPLAVYTRKDGLAAPQVFRLFEDSRGNIWVSTIHTSTKRPRPLGTRRRDLRDLAPSADFPRSRKTYRVPLVRTDPARLDWVQSGTARHMQGRFTALQLLRDGLPPGAIMNIYVDHSGRVWLASARGGLVRVDDTGAERPTFVSYTTSSGTSSNNTEVITEDLHGRLYVGGGHGLDRLDRATGRVKHFTSADGLAPGLFLAAFRDRHGVLWFGMTSGLADSRRCPDAACAASGGDRRGARPVFHTRLVTRGTSDVAS